MKNRKTIKAGMMWLLLPVLLAIAMAFIQTPALAVVDCFGSYDPGGDDDNDGFTNSEECNGITLYDGSIFNSLNPNTKDLFVIMVKVASTKLRADVDWYEFVSRPLAQGGLGIAIHEITQTQAYSDRRVTASSSQKAVRITESLNPGSTDIEKKTFGNAEPGTPNGLDDATIWTQRVINYINTTCGGDSSNCRDSFTNYTGQALVDLYIKHVVAHEIGHMLGPLAPVYNSNFGGYHYKTGTNVEMDQFVKYKSGVFYIGTKFTSGDQTGLDLK